MKYNENKYVLIVLILGKATIGDKQAFYLKLSMLLQEADQFKSPIWS